MMTQEQLEAFHKKSSDRAEWTAFYLRVGQVWEADGERRTITSVQYMELMPDTVVTFADLGHVSGKALLLTDTCRLIEPAL